MKRAKLKTAHTPNSQIGMGDYYGTGIRQKTGRVRDGLGMKPLSKKQVSNPPKALA